MITASIQFYNGGTKTYNVPDGGSLNVDSDWDVGIGTVSFSGSGTINIVGNGHSVNLTQGITLDSKVNVVLDNLKFSCTSDITGGTVTLKNNSDVTINGTASNNKDYPTSFYFDNTQGYSTLNVIGANGTASSIGNSNVNIYNFTPGDKLTVGDTQTTNVVWHQETDGSYTIYKSGAAPSFPTYLKVLGGIHLADNITPDMFEYDESTGTIVCYLKGSMVSTSIGEVPVERLTVGMEVETLNGFSKIIWVGHGKAVVDENNPHADFAGYPIVIRKHAIEENFPSQDLYLTSEHSIYIGHNLIPVRMLVNGISIKYVEMKEYEFFHFECEKHEIVYVNGIETESYLDTGNRRIFGNKENSKLKTKKDLAAPLLTNPKDVKVIHNSLENRAKEVFHDDIAKDVLKSKQIYIEHGDKKIYPFKLVENKFMFMLPKDFTKFKVKFNRVRMSDLIGPWHDDRRDIEVTNLTRSDGRKVTAQDVSVDKDFVSLGIKTLPLPCLLSVTF